MDHISDEEQPDAEITTLVDYAHVSSSSSLETLMRNVVRVKDVNLAPELRFALGNIKNCVIDDPDVGARRQPRMNYTAPEERRFFRPSTSRRSKWFVWSFPVISADSIAVWTANFVRRCGQRTPRKNGVSSPSRDALWSSCRRSRCDTSSRTASMEINTVESLSLVADWFLISDNSTAAGISSNWRGANWQKRKTIGTIARRIIATRQLRINIADTMRLIKEA